MSIEHRIVARICRQAAGTSFSNFVKVPDVKRAFQRARAEADHHSQGYSGNISEKDGYEVRRRDPMSLEAARRFANADLDNNDKWGPAFAVPVGDVKTGKPIRRDIIIEAGSEWEARAAAIVRMEELLRKEHSIRALDVKAIPNKDKLKMKAVPVSKKSEFYWDRSKGRATGRIYGTRADAMTAFKAQDPRVSMAGEVWTLLERKAVVALETVKAVSMKWEVAVEAVPVQAVGPVIGWLFYGIASS